MKNHQTSAPRTANAAIHAAPLRVRRNGLGRVYGAASTNANYAYAQTSNTGPAYRAGSPLLERLTVLRSPLRRRSTNNRRSMT
jgi:hypothetical protein